MNKSTRFIPYSQREVLEAFRRAGRSEGFDWGFHAAKEAQQPLSFESRRQLEAVKERRAAATPEVTESVEAVGPGRTRRLSRDSAGKPHLVSYKDKRTPQQLAYAEGRAETRPLGYAAYLQQLAEGKSPDLAQARLQAGLDSSVPAPAPLPTRVREAVVGVRTSVVGVRQSVVTGTGVAAARIATVVSSRSTR